MLARGVLSDTYSYGLLAQPGGSVGCAGPGSPRSRRLRGVGDTTPGSKPIRKLARPLSASQPFSPGSDGRILPHFHHSLHHDHASYDDADRLETANTNGAVTTYAWDADGNNASVNDGSGVTTYTWDYENRLQAVALPGGGTVTNTYGIDGLRRMREQGQDTARYVWGGVGGGRGTGVGAPLAAPSSSASRLLLETDGSLMTHALYTSSPTGFGPTISQHRDNASAFYHPDHLGTVWNLTNAAGTVTDTYLFDAWGTQLSASGQTENPHRYVGAFGYQTEPTLGLDYVRARWLRPATGTWLSVDPVETEERYGYVGGAPAGVPDASGLQGRYSAIPDELVNPVPRSVWEQRSNVRCAQSRSVL